MLEEHNFSKGQRKRRLDREHSLQNHHRSSLKDHHRANSLLHHHQSRRKDQTYTKRHRQKLLQGSLENVSSHPLGDHKPLESTLRRSRSLAISREDVFTNLEIPNPARARRRSQLIPRAKLIDRCNNSSRSSLQRGLSHESLYTDHSNISILTRGLEYAVPQTQPGFKYREDISASQYLPSLGHLRHSTTDIDSLEHDPAHYKPQPQQQVQHSHHQTEDSGLSLPNYYPDSKCDTDHSFTDNISVGNFTRDSKYRQSSLYPDSTNISYDENIVLSKTQLYDKVEEHYIQSKPRTIRGNTPYYNPEPESTTNVIPRSLPNFSTTTREGYESDSTLSDYDPKYYEPVERTSSDSNQNQGQRIEEEEPPIIQELQPEKTDNSVLYQKQEDFQNTKPQFLQSPESIQTYETKSEFSNIEANPIYDEIPITAADRDLIKTSIQVPCEDQQEQEEYKTVVSVPEQQRPQTSDEEDVKEAKKHSHNYLKEFLETQKGSKKPLQNFLSKRISRAFNSSNDSLITNSTAKTNSTNSKKSNLVENQYFSLPDITVSKNLQKCEKIDRKLRKCEKLSKSPSDVSTNRFIVNIGNHFDVTARSSIPVDFELKISKIPKKRNSASKADKTFIDAVKSLNQTLSGKNKGNNDQSPKLIINGEEINTKDIYQRDKEVEVIIEDTKMANKIPKEFQEKINTMRNYWGNMVGTPEEESSPKEEKQDPIKEVNNKCKIVGVQTKIEEVKKKFEGGNTKKDEPPDDPEKLPSKVQMTKQFFENNDAQIQKAPTKQGLVENPYFDNQFESLNPNTLELIEQEEKQMNSKNSNSERIQNKIGNSSGNEKPPSIVITNGDNKLGVAVAHNGSIEIKEKYPITQEKSIIKKAKSIEPEFDHVRYRVVKSDLFQKKIFAKCEKESQFDGLMQYLQDYSFQELLIDNNIVIIEPIRTNIQYVSSNNTHHPKKVTKFIRTPGKPPSNNESSGLRKHFFYHPIRVNREVNDDELPNPDTVNKVRQLFEGQLMPRSQSSKNLDSLTKQTVQYIRPVPVDPDKDRCSASDGSSNMSECDQDEFYDENDVCCEYVSEDILEKIRECGTSVTYYGGRVTSKRKPQAMTKAIMEEIKNQKKCNCNCKLKPPPYPQHNTRGQNEQESKNNPGGYQGVKFKLLKSNSCSSRLELVGTKNLSEYRKKFIMKQKQLLDEHNLKKQKPAMEKNSINETIKEINQNNAFPNWNNNEEQDDYDNGTSTSNNSQKVIVNGHQYINNCYNNNNNNSSNDNGNNVSRNSMTTMITKVTTNGNGNANTNGNNNQTPKIIAEEMKTKKLIQWGEMREDNKTYSGITYTHNTTTVNSNNNKQKAYEFYEKLKVKQRKAEEMEFEPYEIANCN